MMFRLRKSLNNSKNSESLKLRSKYPGCTLFVDPRGPPNRIAISVCEEIRDLNPEKFSYTCMLIDLTKMEHKSKDIMQFNPRGKVPTLIDDGEYTGSEGWAIANFLCQNYDLTNKLYPVDLKQRARLDQINFVSYELMQVVIGSYPNLPGVLFWNQKPDYSKREAVIKFIQFYDSLLSSKPNNDSDYGEEFNYLGVNYFNCADIFAAVPLQAICTTLESEEELFKDYPRVLKWYKRVLEQPSFKRSSEVGAKELGESYKRALAGTGSSLDELNMKNYTSLTQNIKRYQAI